jgi:hypothetical protein
MTTSHTSVNLAIDDGDDCSLAAGVAHSLTLMTILPK